MQILITSGTAPLAQSLAAALSQSHEIRLTDRTFVSSEFEFAQSPLSHDFATNLLVRDMETIIHVAAAQPGESAESQIDYLTRGTYNLLWAAAEEGVQRVIYLSSLDIMTQYDEQLFIQEHWRPRTTTAATALATQLGESTCREFAREHKIEVVVLRLGKVVKAAEVAGLPVDSMWVDEADVVQAVSQALTADVGRWSIFHIQADSPEGRFPINRAKDGLGFHPAMQFQVERAQS